MKSKLCNHCWCINKETNQLEIFKRDNTNELITKIPMVEMWLMVQDWKHIIDEKEIVKLVDKYYKGELKD